VNPIFVLDEPHPHRIRFGQPARFLGIALALEGDPINVIEVWRDGTRVFSAPSNLPCPELAAFPVPRAASCRFDFQLTVDDARYELRANGSTLFVYEVGDAAPLAALAAAVDSKPLPDAQRLAVTQGIPNPSGYRDSIVSGLITMEAYLRAAGSEQRAGEEEPAGSPARRPLLAPRSILDIGCGTGRLLLGWHCDDPTRRLTGTDIDADLIAWNREHLGEVARWEVGSVWPPVPLADHSVDLVQLISVFTHLPLDCQRAWVSEVRRVLRPGGTAIITRHGDLYASLLLDAAALAQHARSGYYEVAGGAEGGSGFGTFHAPRFARELFAEFASIAHYERGIIEPPQRHFPIASLQDVYKLRA
jgi:SAM-dependent methyltransferase